MSDRLLAALANPRTLGGQAVNAPEASQADIARAGFMNMPGPVQYAAALPAILAKMMIADPYQAYSAYMDRGGHQPGGNDPQGLDLGIATSGAAAPGIVAGPRVPRPVTTAEILGRIPQRDPAVTGGGMRWDPQWAPNSSGDLTRRGGFFSMADHMDPPRREARSFANDNVRGPVAVATKGGDTPVRVTPDRVTALLDELGMTHETRDRGGTTYVKFDDPLDPRLMNDPQGRPNRGALQSQPTVRIPSDGHAGRPMTPSEAGVLFDTASQPGVHELNPLAATDQAGRPYADFRVLEETLRRRFGPRQDPQTPAPGMTPDPNQPRLLASGAPMITYGGDDGNVPIYADPLPPAAETGNHGRFANLPGGTRMLRALVGQDAARLNEEIAAMSGPRKSQSRLSRALVDAYAPQPHD